jgi:hypothetical protein
MIHGGEVCPWSNPRLKKVDSDGVEKLRRVLKTFANMEEYWRLQEMLVRRTDIE